MVLRRPGMNRSLNRENPDILIMMIAEQQIMRGGGEDKGEKREKEGTGPLKPVTQMSDTASKSNVFTHWYFTFVWLFFISLSELKGSIFIHPSMALCKSTFILALCLWHTLLVSSS